MSCNCNSAVSVAAEKELTVIEKRCGKLKPAAVIKAAADPKSPLHDRFTWSDKVGGNLYRLIEARRLIVAYTNVISMRPKTSEEIEAAKKLPTRDWSSLRTKPLEAAGRGQPAVRKASKVSLLDSALWELESFERRYSSLKQLAPVFDAVAALRRKLGK